MIHLYGAYFQPEVLALLFGTQIIYFAPTLIAEWRLHPNNISIFILNLFLGWTFLGWVFALIWAFIKLPKLHNEERIKLFSEYVMPATFICSLSFFLFLAIIIVLSILRPYEAWWAYAFLVMFGYSVGHYALMLLFLSRPSTKYLAKWFLG